jgi:hypothetical protein
VLQLPHSKSGENGGTDLWRGRRGSPRDSPRNPIRRAGCGGRLGASRARRPGWWRWWERGEARSRRVTEAKEVEKGIS